MSATRPNTDGLRSDGCSALTMLTDTTTRSWLAKRPAVQRMPHCYLLGTADAALDIWFETHALANAQLSARTQRHVLHQVHDASGAAKLSSREPRPSCRASNIRGRVATDPLMRARRYPRTRRRNEWN